MKSLSQSPILFYGFYGLLSLTIATLPLMLYYRQNKKKKSSSSITVVADIGGTNSRFQLIKIVASMEEPKVLYEHTYKSIDFKEFSALFSKFLKDCKASCSHYPNNAVLAVAGPVKYNKVTPSNLKHWGELNGGEIMKEFNLESCIFLNDFEAIGYAILKLQKHDFFKLNEEANGFENEKISVMGPGTGLGYCTIVPAPYKNGVRYYVWGGEGGHAAFSPVNEIQTEYMQWVMKKKNLTYLCTEKAFAGPGIKPIYEFLHEKFRELVFDDNFTTEAIVEKGTKNEDVLCNKVVDFFLDLYANEIGNMVCRERSLSGIYLVGSLTNAVKDYLVNVKKTDFLNAYHNKDLMKELVLNVPIYIVTKHNLGLLGAFAEAQRALI